MKKIYEEFKKNIENVGELKKAYFTTFELSIDFFERYILPLILGENIPENDFEYENLNLALENSNIKIKVFYDFAELRDNKKTVVKTIPIFVENGFFHPKVCFIEGSKKSILMVGSNNLTLSGWGRNIEGFYVVEVDELLKKQIDYFFENINNKEKLNEFKEYDFNQKYNFVFGKKLKELLKDEVIVFSPYFSNINEMKKLLNINPIIIPDVKNGKIRLNILPDIDFYTFKKLEEDRFNHSKIYVTKEFLIIGSYNFTKEAFENNIEAALVIKGNYFDEFKECFLKKIEVNPMSEEELKEEEKIFEDRFYVGISLSFNYENDEFEYEIFRDINENKVVIDLPGKVSIKLAKIDELKQSELQKIKKGLIKDKTFILKEKEEVIFKGVINEINSKDNRMPYTPETFEELFYSFTEEKPITAKKTFEKYISKILSNDGKAQFNQEMINYYVLFDGFKKVEEMLKGKITKKELEKVGFYYPNSISNIKEIFEKEKDKLSKTMQLIFVYELNSLIDKFNKKASRFKSIEMIDKIKDYPKNKELEKILKAFYDTKTSK